MKLSRYTAQTPPPRSSGLIRATDIGALTQTGEQAKWSGVGAFGRGLEFAGRLAFQARQHRQALDDDVESGLFSQKSEERINLGLDEVTNFDWNTNMPQPGSEDYYERLETYNIDERDAYGKAIYGGIAEDIEKQIASIKSPRVKAAKEKWWLENQGDIWNKVRHVNALNHEDWVRTQMTKMAETAYKNGDIEKGDLWNDRMDEHNLITSQSSEKAKKNGKIIADTSITTQFAQVIMAQTGYQDAIDFVMAQDIDVMVRDRVLSDLATQERIRSTRHKQLREETNRQMLANYWDGKLRDPQVITDAFRAGYLDDTDAKYLRAAIMNPEPPKLDLQSLATVKQAIDEIGTNTKTVQQVLSILYANINSIDPTTGKSLINEIFSEQDRNKSEMKRESRARMEELIRDRDKFTGMFTDDERQILASAEAYLMLDTEIQKAIEADKPLERRDIMIKAIQIGRQMKKKIKQEEVDSIPPGFEPETEGFLIAPRAPDYTPKGKPITKGALAKPDFVLTSEGEPEKVFDSEGREIGLRRKSGAVFGIGYIAIFNGKKYEYTGNGNWKLVK